MALNVNKFGLPYRLPQTQLILISLVSIWGSQIDIRPDLPGAL